MFSKNVSNARLAQSVGRIALNLGFGGESKPLLLPSLLKLMLMLQPRPLMVWLLWGLQTEMREGLLKGSDA